MLPPGGWSQYRRAALPHRAGSDAVLPPTRSGSAATMRGKPRNPASGVVVVVVVFVFGVLVVAAFKVEFLEGSVLLLEVLVEQLP